MSKKFVPYDKMSKRARKEADKQKRGDWGAVNPVTRTIPDKRNKMKEDMARKETEE